MNQLILESCVHSWDSKQCFTKDQLIYSLIIIIRLATCFDPTCSSSGLHNEPIDIRKLRTLLGFQTMCYKRWIRMVRVQLGTNFQLYHLHVMIFLKSVSLNLLEHLRHVQACNGIALPLSLC
jgi:hypothetical protein